jgi:hypothetical protein
MGKREHMSAKLRPAIGLVAQLLLLNKLEISEALPFLNFALNPFTRCP